VSVFFEYFFQKKTKMESQLSFFENKEIKKEDEKKEEKQIT